MAGSRNLEVGDWVRWDTWGTRMVGRIVQDFGNGYVMVMVRHSAGSYAQITMFHGTLLGHEPTDEELLPFLEYEVTR